MDKYPLVKLYSNLANKFGSMNWHSLTDCYDASNRSSRIVMPIIILMLLGWAPQILAHSRYEWMIPYKTKTGVSCCGVDDCGKILSFDVNNKFITIQNQFGRVWKVRYRFASATLHYSPDSNKYACGTYSNYVPNYVRCIWLPQEAKGNQQQRFTIANLLNADWF